MNIVSLQRRLVSTIIDKMLILLFFILVSLSLSSGYPGGELGVFTGLTFTKYNNIESKMTMHERHIIINNLLEKKGLPMHEFTEEDYEYYKTSLDVYQKYVLIFVIVNLLYYLFCEFLFKASLGKKILKCQIIRKNGSEIDKRDIFIRTGIFASLLLLTVTLQMYLNLNAYAASILFFGILDFTVFTKQMSLVDKYSDTIVVTQK